jgi:MYXO-CTERM domain-containing protein
VRNVTDSTIEVDTAARHHEVSLTGLNANTEYRFELEVGGNIYPGQFMTAPVGSTPFSFLVYGDNRSSPEQHAVVVDAMLQESSARFAVNTGDLVSAGENESHWDSFFEVEAPLLARVPLYVAIGNHEVDNLNWDIPKRLFAEPTDVPPASDEESFFHVVYGNVELIIINLEVDNLYRFDFWEPPQVAWLTEVLNNPPAGVEHRFVFVHKGPYSSKSGRTGEFWMRQWLDDFKAAGVDVLFSGHDHYAEKGWAINGMNYVIHGGGGAPLYDHEGLQTHSDHTIVYGETRLGYALVEIDGPKAEVTVKGVGGEVVTYFSYGDSASPECSAPTDCGGPPAYACSGGAWECRKNACQYTCDSSSGGGSLLACLNDDDCSGTTCTGGDSVCERPDALNPLTWFCRCDIPPECTQASDCIQPPPVAGCAGTWACEMGACEFTPSAGVCEPPDAGVADSGNQTSPPDAGNVDPPPPDSGIPTAPDDAGSANPADSGLGAQVDSGEKPDTDAAAGGCGCALGDRSQSGGWVLALVLLGLIQRRRRKFPS